jgi:hypothetical protein
MGMDTSPSRSSNDVILTSMLFMFSTRRVWAWIRARRVPLMM